MTRTACLLLLACSTLMQAQDARPPDVEHVLDVLRGHVQQLEGSVPNFICQEQIVSQLFEKNKLKKETRAQAVLTTTRSVKAGHGIFSEGRADMKINGKPTRRNEIEGPFVWKGGPAYGDLHYLFNSSHGLECRSYRLLGQVQLEGKEALLMEAHVAETANQNDMCPDLPPDSSDRVWLDPRSLNVLRIESHDPPATPIPGAVLTLTVDYAPVVFDGVEYYLPAHFISRLDFPGTSRHLQYEAFFSDYHKYGAESVVHIDGAQ
jgi:hypothetical protein